MIILLRYKFLMIILISFLTLLSSIYIYKLNNSYLYNLELSMYFKDNNKLLELEKLLNLQGFNIYRPIRTNFIFIIRKSYIKESSMLISKKNVRNFMSKYDKNILFKKVKFKKNLKYNKKGLIFLLFILNILFTILIVLIINYKKMKNEK